MISHSTYTNNKWTKDGNIEAFVIRISNTGASDTDYLIDNPLGRVPVGVQIIMANKACNVIVKDKSESKIVLQFDNEFCDINLRVW